MTKKYTRRGILGTLFAAPVVAAVAKDPPKGLPVEYKAASLAPEEFEEQTATLQGYDADGHYVEDTFVVESKELWCEPFELLVCNLTTTVDDNSEIIPMIGGESYVRPGTQTVTMRMTCHLDDTGTGNTYPTNGIALHHGLLGHAKLISGNVTLNAYIESGRMKSQTGHLPTMDLKISVFAPYNVKDLHDLQLNMEKHGLQCQVRVS